MSELQSPPPQNEPAAVPRHPIQSYVLGAILVILLLAVLRLFTPFFTALLWSILLYVIIGPLHRRVTRNIDRNTWKGKLFYNFWAMLFSVGTMVLILFPLFMVFTMFFQQVMEMGRNFLNFLNERPEFLRELYGTLAELGNRMSAGLFDITAYEIETQARGYLTNTLQHLVVVSGNLVLNVGGLSLSILVMLFSLFFLFADGPYLSNLFLRAIPIRREYVGTLSTKFLDITRNLFLGYIIVALLQGTIAFVVYTIFGINGALVFAVLTFVLVFIPLIGAMTIWLPLGIVMIAGGDIARGILFMIVSAVFISSIDNILRPFFLKDRIQLHPLIILFAILGGLAVFGFNGLILGPMLVIFFMTVLDLFLAEHRIGQKDHA